MIQLRLCACHAMVATWPRGSSSLLALFSNPWLIAVFMRPLGSEMKKRERGAYKKNACITETNPMCR